MILELASTPGQCPQPCITVSPVWPPQGCAQPQVSTGWQWPGRPSRSHAQVPPWGSQTGQSHIPSVTRSSSPSASAVLCLQLSRGLEPPFPELLPPSLGFLLCSRGFPHPCHPWGAGMAQTPSQLQQNSFCLVLSEPLRRVAASCFSNVESFRGLGDTVFWGFFNGYQPLCSSFSKS